MMKPYSRMGASGAGAVREPLLQIIICTGDVKVFAGFPPGKRPETLTEWLALCLSK
jgi:hypothetical protein